MEELNNEIKRLHTEIEKERKNVLSMEERKNNLEYQNKTLEFERSKRIKAEEQIEIVVYAY